MMVRIVDYRAVEPLKRFNLSRPINIPITPNRLNLATLTISIPQSAAKKNRVELIGTAGVRGITGISQLKFTIFRDRLEIFNTVQGIESAGSEQNYVVTFQGIDFNVGSGNHTYVLTVENMTPGTTAQVVGPVSFSALAISRE